MKGLTTYTLGELSINGKGSYGIGAPAVDFSKDKYMYLRITDINDDGTLSTSDRKSVDDPEAHKYVLHKNDIVFARTGNSTGRSYFYDERDGELVYAGFLIKFSLDPAKVNPKVLKYYTHSKPYYDWVKSFDTGATRGNINAQTFASMPIALPDKETQDRIVDILSAIDNKIRLNNRINHNLEEQAQALYKSWFVDFEPFRGGNFVDSELGLIPEGWRVGTLSEISSITMGQSPSGTSFNEVGDGIVFYQGRTEFGNRFPSIRLYTTEPTRFAERFSVLLSVRAPVGDINIAKEKCCIGRGLASIHGLFQSFVYYTVGSLKPVLNRFNGEGTVFGSINRKELEELKIIVPPAIIQEDFNSIVSRYDRDIYNRSSENETLCQLRDKILPKLMSGELKINDLTC